MTGSGLLLVAALALPLAMVFACLWRGVRRQAANWLVVAPLPGLAAALFAGGGSQMIAPPPLRLVLALDAPGALLLGGAALLWSAAGGYAAAYLRGKPGLEGFAVWWLLTLAGSLGCFIVADMTSFYLMFSLASLSAYGLVGFERTPRAARAASVYMALALLGEALILLGFVMLATAVPGGNPLIREAVAALPGSPFLAPSLVLLVLGFGLKMGLVPLHVWMPLAHPVAPMPASAVLSGIIVKAGVIGLIRFLPLDAALPGAGMALVALGLLTAFYAVAVGVTQDHPKTILAYSTISQMGLVAAILGAGLAGGVIGTGLLVAYYAFHHMLVKGALFLGVGVVMATGRGRWRVLAPMAVLSLSLAGLPLTSGALAKLVTKPLFGYGPVGTLAALTAVGSALLMLHFMRQLARLPSGTGERPGIGIVLPWVLVALASLVLPWALFIAFGGPATAVEAAAKALWEGSWPIIVGGALAWGLARAGSRLPRLPEGDVIVLFAPVQRAAMRAGGWIERAEAQLRRWPVAGMVLVALALFLGAALRFG